ncbi:MAG: hypothetical protein AB7O26_14155 [Planctomycetaceae bacterium]
MKFNASNGSIRQLWKRPFLFASLGVIAGILLMTSLQLVAPDARPSMSPTSNRGVGKSDAPLPPLVSPIDSEAVRAKAWALVSPRLDEADAASAAGIEIAVAEIETFFLDRMQGTRPLAGELLSIGGKWKVIQSKLSGISDLLPFSEQDADVAFLNQKFGEHVFTNEDARLAIEGSIKAYIQKVAAIENQLLVRIRADLSDGELGVNELIPALKRDDLLRQEYEKLLGDVHQMVKGEVSHDVGREVASLLAGEVAAQIALRVAIAVGTRLGVSAGVLTVGAASSWATFGVGLVAAIIVDFAIDWAERLAGHEPELAIAAKIDQTLNDIRVLFVDGDPKARRAYFKIRQLEQNAAVESSRREFQESARSIEQSGNLGIRFELQSFHETRQRLRRDAIRRLIIPGPA